MPFKLRLFVVAKKRMCLFKNVKYITVYCLIHKFNCTLTNSVDIEAAVNYFNFTHLLTVEIREARNLPALDLGGTVDPFVQVKRCAIYLSIVCKVFLVTLI